MDQGFAAIIAAGISSVVTVIGLFIGYHQLKKQLQTEHNNALNEAKFASKEKLYTDVFHLNNRLRAFPELIFDEEQIVGKVVKTALEIKLLGSKEVVRAYNEFFDFIGKYYAPYEKYRNAIDPENNYDDSCNVSPEEAEAEFDREVEAYEQQNKPKLEDVKTVCAKVEAAMRVDLGEESLNE